MFRRKKALIIGCGWVGFRFAQKLLTLNFEVTATTTSEHKINALEAEGISPLLLDFNFETDSETVAVISSLHYDLVLVSVPAKKREHQQTCLMKFERLAKFLQKIQAKSIIYLSSVGIYPSAPYLINETNIPNSSLDPKLFQTEQTLAMRVNMLNILRLGGIFGDNRIPGKHFSAKVCEVGNQFANYIHLDDIMAIILCLYHQRIEGQLFNAVSPLHPSKKEITLQMAEKYGFAPPSSFENVSFDKKVISPAKLISDLNYQFIYENPLDY